MKGRLDNNDQLCERHLSLKSYLCHYIFFLNPLEPELNNKGLGMNHLSYTISNCILHCIPN